MGLMECLPDHSRIVYTPHPISCEGQRNYAAPLVKGETLGSFLRREVPDWTGDAWEVRINGVLVPVEVMERVRPKNGTLIEVRGVAKKQALYIVAMITLTYFTMGAGATWAGALGASGMAATAVYAAAYVAGSVLINKVLGPKPASAGGQEQTVYNIGASPNQARPYQPLPLVFGRVKFAPDIISAPYTWYEGDDQYLGMVLTPGIGVHSVEALTNGDAPLSAFEGVQVYHAGFPGMPEQQIPLYSDADTIQGGELNKDQTWVQRATPARTVRIQINLEYILGDQDSKGRPYTNRETVEAQYRVTGATNWMPLVSRNFANSSYDPKRATLARDVAEGQYDVRVRILGRAIDGGGSNGRSQWQWTTMTAVQADTATYAGIPRIGVRIKATGQLNGAPDELRCVAHSFPIPVWTGTGWVTEETSNPGAQILQYARGITADEIIYDDASGQLINLGPKRIAGIGLSDDMIDIAALQAFMLHCAANQFEYNYVVKDARSHDEMVNSLAAAGFGQVTWAGGRLSVVWAAADQPLSGVVNMATIKKGEFQVDYTLANAADGIEYTYYDAEDWSTKTIRVPAPGVTTMLNPAQVTGEGVTSEAHAAMLARWHLAQSLYQYKDISFATDIEHLSYQRLSLLSLSHDLTQWGFSGRLRGASIDGGVVTLQLDESVPAPPRGRAYVGLRIPGERTYRVFGVQAFTGETDTLTLTGAWPADAPLPGDTAGNPAHDTLWCYDFKATPGYRVRVVAIEPESDLKGARVAVVPEGPEFWNYVLTGEYIPAPNQSLLQTRPVASNLTVSERDVVQGDTVFTELVATFDVDGPVGDVIVQMSNENGELVEVARTTSRTAAWRVPGAGTYQVVVRPFSPDGQPGVAVATIYSTIGADAPPVLVDLFDVQERSGGVRLYTWGWLSGTTQSADFAGVEIRYVAGNVPAPDWAAMTPVGEDGYHTAPFEAVIPESGQWTFAARSRNTSGTLSTGMRVVTKTLGANLGEQIGGIGDSIDYITQQQVAQQEALDAEAFARVQADIAVAEAAGADATAKANAARDEALAAVDALAAEVGEIVNAPDWSASETYQAGWLVKYNGRLYRAEQVTTNQQPDLFPTVWEELGEYSSVAEIAAAALTMSTANASDIAAEAARLDALYVRMPAGSGELATTALVATKEQASVDRDNALGSRAQAIEVRMPGGSGALATQASVADLQTAMIAADGVNAAAITSVQANQSGGGNLLEGSDFSGPSGFVVFHPAWGDLPLIQNMHGENWRVDGTNNYGFTANSASGYQIYIANNRFPVTPGERVIASAYLAAHGCKSWIEIWWFDVNGNEVGNHIAGAQVVKTGGKMIKDWGRSSAVGDAPANAAFCWFVWVTHEPVGGMSSWIMRPMLEIGRAGQTSASPWSAGGSGLAGTIASAVQSLQAGIDAEGQARAQAITAVQATANGAQSTATQALTASNNNAAAIVQVQSGLSLADFTATLTWDFRGSYNDFTFANANVALFPVVSESGMVLDATADDPQLLSPGFSVSGRDSYVVRAMIRRRTPGAWDGLLLWQTDSHGFGGDHFLMASAPPADGQFHTVEWDLSSNVDWRSSQINRVRIDLEGNAGTTTDIRWISIGSKASDGNPSSGPISSATFALQAAQDAQITLTTNVNGHVTGMVSKNDGQRGVISFLADVFEIITSGTVGVRFTRRNGGYFMRFYAASIQTIIGINFGASNNLCFWYGPNVGEENCTQANGTIWFNNAGSAYFGGSLSAGVLKNAAQSTQISAAATVDTGPFTTNGGARVVNSSMSYTNAGYTATDQGGTVALSAGVVLERSRDNGATWTQISNFTATGQRIFVEFEPGLGYNYEFSLTGSTTYTDNTGGTANVNYRLRITSSSGPWPFNFGTGPNPLGRQNLAVISVEQ